MLVNIMNKKVKASGLRFLLFCRVSQVSKVTNTSTLAVSYYLLMGLIVLHYF